MEVKLINKEETKKLFENWGNVSKVCYDTQTNYPEKIGKGCMNSGHMSGSRGDFFKFYVSDIPRFTVDQAVRHEVGVFKNVGSFRYINEGMFIYEIPEQIKDNLELVEKYNNHMISTQELYQEIQNYVFEKTNMEEIANESARYILPMSTHTSFVIGFTIEALIHFMNVRLCVRAEDKIRELAILMKKQVLDILPSLKDKLVPNCQALLYCPEHKSCGAYPKKEDVQKLIEEYLNKKG